jgi:hypothetical protein
LAALPPGCQKSAFTIQTIGPDGKNRKREALAKPPVCASGGFRVQGSGFRVQIVVAIVVDKDWDKDYDNDGRTTTIGTKMGDRWTTTATITVYAERLSNRPP